MQPLHEGKRVRIIKGSGRWKRGRLDRIWNTRKGRIYFVVADNGDWYFKRSHSELEVIA